MKEHTVESYLALMKATASGLVDGYTLLATMVGRDGSPAAESGGSGSVEVPLPVRAGVIDSMTAIDDLVEQFMPLVYGTLRMGVWSRVARTRAERTVTGLRFLASSFAATYESDPHLGIELGDALWEARSHVATQTRSGVRPFRRSEPCSECGEVAVWVRPDSWTTRCAACGVVVGDGEGGSVIAYVSTMPR